MNYIYHTTVPVFKKNLKNLDALLVKAEAFVKEKGISEATLMDERLAPDMFPFKKQVQIVSDNAKGSTARLAGIEIPVYEDTEVTFADLHARIQKTLAFLDTVSEASFDGAEDRQVTLPYFPGKHMTGFDFTMEYAIPNFFFHFVTVYAILRKLGMDIGKQDYTGGLPLKDTPTV